MVDSGRFPKGRKGAKILSIYWFLILFIVSGAIIALAAQFYGTPFDVRLVESSALGNQIATCLTPKGYLNLSALTENFKKNFMNDCHLNFNVEDDYGWTNQSEYYVEVGVYKYDQNAFGFKGDEVFNVSEGNKELKTFWQLNQIDTKTATGIFNPQRKVTTIVIHSTEGSSASSAMDTLAGKKLSIHYMIDRDGTVFSPENGNVPPRDAGAFKTESEMASHAGCTTDVGTIPSCSSSCLDSGGLLSMKCQSEILGGTTFPLTKYGQISTNPAEGCCIHNINVNSIGIELVNLGAKCTSSTCTNPVSADGKEWQNFTSAQMNSLANLVANIAERYKIPLDRTHIIGHYQITNYKTDPGPAFNWTLLMQEVKAKEAAGSSQTTTSKNSNLPQGQQRSFYAVDQKGNQYIVQIISIVRKTEKNAK